MNMRVIMNNKRETMSSGDLDDLMKEYLANHGQITECIPAVAQGYSANAAVRRSVNAKRRQFRKENSQ